MPRTAAASTWRVVGTPIGAAESGSNIAMIERRGISEMQGKFFGYRKFTPCPACGQERILLDYDDTAIVVPVVWEDVDTCDGEIVVTAPVYAGGYWERRSAEGRSCPKCGGPVQRHEEYIRNGVTHVCVFRCTKPRTSPQYRRVQGCPQCSNVTTWYGVGLTAGD